MSYSIKSLDIVNKSELDSIIAELGLKYPYSDVYEVSECVEISRHTHSDSECRLILSGVAAFNIDGVLMECVSGTLLEIEANVPHSFKYSGGEVLKVIRFFSNEKEWKAVYENV